MFEFFRKNGTMASLFIGMAAFLLMTAVWLRHVTRWNTSQTSHKKRASRTNLVEKSRFIILKKILNLSHTSQNARASDRREQCHLRSEHSKKTIRAPWLEWSLSVFIFPTCGGNPMWTLLRLLLTPLLILKELTELFFADSWVGCFFGQL